MHHWTWHFIIKWNNHMVIYGFFSLTGTKPAFCVLRNQLQRLGWLLVPAVLHRMHNVLWLLKGAIPSLLERGVLGWVNGGLYQQHSYIFPIRKVDNVVFHLRFLRHSKMSFFISRWFSLLGIAAASLTNVQLHHTSAVNIVLLTQSCTVLSKTASGNWYCWSLPEMCSAPFSTDP